MIMDVSGAFAGRKNDHQKQNDSNISDRLTNCQEGIYIQYNSVTDKGMHTQPCIVPMYNNLINTVAQDFLMRGK